MGDLSQADKTMIATFVAAHLRHAVRDEVQRCMEERDRGGCRARWNKFFERWLMTATTHAPSGIEQLEYIPAASVAVFQGTPLTHCVFCGQRLGTSGDWSERHP